MHTDITLRIHEEGGCESRCENACSRNDRGSRHAMVHPLPLTPPATHSKPANQTAPQPHGSLPPLWHPVTYKADWTVTEQLGAEALLCLRKIARVSQLFAFNFILLGRLASARIFPLRQACLLEWSVPRSKYKNAEVKNTRTETALCA